MRTGFIAKLALSTLFLTGMLVVKADDSEVPVWKKNSKMGTKSIVTGTTTKWVVLDPISGGGYWDTTNTYTTISCCVQATDSDACNSSGADSRC